MSEEMYTKLAQVVIVGEPEQAEELAQQALDQGLDPLVCINEGLTKGIQHVGELFASGEYFLPDLIIGAEAMKNALAVLEPALTEGGPGREVLGHAILGTVEGDLHDIGKTLVGTMLTANGFKVTDLGTDVPAEEFVQALKAAIADRGAKLVGASALLTTTMSEQQKIIKTIEEAGLRDEVKIMVGGAPVTQSWAEKIGADGFAKDAISAVGLAKRLVGAG
ncbi:MAG: corrinoid protein [Anaerolineae bacterium]|jgi:corrinoid protein of di/trimethylamine methyltransferase